MKSNRMEKLFWSIALPGFGQFLNRQYIKGIILLALEFLVNVQSHLNLVIVSSFHGDIQQAIDQSDYQWLMFYPCLYMFGIWDSYKNGGGELSPFSYLPCVLAAFFATLGVIYSVTFRIAGVLLGPVWLPILFCFIGLGVGFLLMKWIRNQSEKQDKALD
jgi:hypothetical protein